MNITLKQLRYFLALARHGHFGHAAGAVFVTQPALSMQIKALEDECGAALVERTPAGVLLTPQGRAVAAHAERVLAEVAGLEQCLRQPGQGGRLALGMIPTLAPYLLPVALPRLRSHDISRDLHLREAQTDRLIDELLAGGLDAAVVATPAPDDRLVAMPLFRDRFLLAGSAARIEALGDGGTAPRPTGWTPASFCCSTRGIAWAIRRWNCAG